MSFAYVKEGPRGVSPDKREEAMAMAKPLTPRSERPRRSWGSLEMSLQMIPGACTAGRKCIFKHGHAQPCWPADSTLSS